MLAALALTAYQAWTKHELWMHLLLVILGVAWLGVDSSFEGPVLIALTDTHGIVAADLVAVVAFLIAVLSWFRPHSMAIEKPDAVDKPDTVEEPGPIRERDNAAHYDTGDT